MKARLKKLKPVENAECPTADATLYIPGALNANGTVSPPVDYEVEGDILYPIEIGKPVIMDRQIRNGVVARGIFQTSKIVKIEENLLYTCNSVYKLEVESESI